VRAFVALDLPDSVAIALGRLQEHVPEGRLVPPENLHLTLLFLDDQPVPALEDLHHELGRLAPAAFDLRLTGLGSFGGKAPRTLHAEAAPDPALIGLQAQIREAVRRAGIERPRTRFRPHVTLARFGAGLGGDGQRRLASFIARHGLLGIPPAPVESFGLYCSTLRPDGPVYDPLATYPIGAAVRPEVGTNDP
jgi:2'-5' RNA ligase